MKALLEPKQDNIIIPIWYTAMEYITTKIGWKKSQYYEDEDGHIQKIPQPVKARPMEWYENFSPLIQPANDKQQTTKRILPKRQTIKDSSGWIWKDR